MGEKTQISNPKDPLNGETRNIYIPSPNASKINRTVIHGVKRPSYNDVNKMERHKDRERLLQIQDRPITGILYSVSRDSLGELFPLYEGRNTIGNNPDSDVYLSEGSIAFKHAVILVRKINDENQMPTLNVGITDYESQFGSFVNEERLGFDKRQLSGGEIIRIGNSYEFLFLLFKPWKQSLKEAGDFEQVKRVSPINNGNTITSPIFVDNYRNKETPHTPMGEKEESILYGRTKAKREDHAGNKTIDNGTGI